MSSKNGCVKVGLWLTIVGILGFSGCAQYNPSPLKRLAKQQSTHTKHEESVSLSYRIFDRKDCKRYLDRNVLTRGYQPIHITVFNNSSRFFSVSAKSINLPTENPKKVARALNSCLARRAITALGISVGGSALTLALLGSLVNATDRPDRTGMNAFLVILGVPILGAAGIILSLTTALIHDKKTDEANMALEADLATKTLRRQLLKPHSSLNALLFIPRNSFNKDFTFTLTDKETGEHLLVSTQEPYLILSSKPSPTALPMRN